MSHLSISGLLLCSVHAPVSLNENCQDLAVEAVQGADEHWCSLTTEGCCLNTSSFLCIAHKRHAFFCACSSNTQCDLHDSALTLTRHVLCSRMTAEYVYFSVVIFIALMLILIVIVNFQWAASFFTFLLLLAMLIYGIIGTVFLLLAVVGHDE